MNIFYFFYLIILFLPGETIFQLSFLKKKEKLLQFSIIEHLLYIILIGLSVSSTVCLILAIFQVLNLIFLILIDLGIFLISIFLNVFNRKFINKYLLIFRIIEYFKSKESISFKKAIKGNYVTIISIIICFIIYFEALSYFKYFPIPDIWYFTQWAIDIVKYNPYLFYSYDSIGWYLGDPFYIKFQNYYLAIFLLFDINSWQFIIHAIIPTITLICLILIILSFTAKRGDNGKYLPILFLFSSYFLLNWFFYSLPSNISIIIGLLLINSLLDKSKRSYILIIFLAFFMYLFHSITAALLAISIIFSLIVLLINNLFNTEKKREILRFLKKNRIFLIILISIIAIITVIFLYYFSYQVLEYFITRQQMNLTDFQERAISPPIMDWIGANVGIHVLILSILAILFIYPMIRNKKVKTLNSFEIQKSKIYILLFFWLLLIEVIIICLFFPYWYLFTGIPYLAYRYFIYLDLACIILAPYSFRFVIKHIQTLKIKKRNIKRYLMIFKCGFLISTVLLIWIHSIVKYNLRLIYQYVPEAFIDTNYWLETNTPSESIYFVSPYTNSVILYQYQHCIMDDRIFINESLGNEIFNDSLYVNGFDDNYNKTFREYVFVKNKPIDKRWAYTHSIPENYTDKKVDYIIINDYNNYYLTNLLLNDTIFFEVIKTAFYIDELFGVNYTIYVFHTIGNYNDF